ncbi:MAG: gluconolaconase, partial [Cyclobacteriaceae bacterium]|nr:gluconolaconase [Cyclobacteriaceae bacterium]
MKNLLLLIAAVAIFACSATKKQLVKNEEVVALVPSLELVWETDTLMTTAECVIYDDKRNLIYVANINLNPWEKDGNGFISKIDTLGNIVDLKWVSGLDAPKGLGIFNNSLFVNDIDQIIEIDLSSGNIKGRTKIGGNPTLNDLTIAEDGTLYASGS